MAHADDTPGGAALPLRTPEQVSEDLGRDEHGRPLVSPFTIRRLVREGAIECSRLSRSRVALTPAQVEAMLSTMRQPAGSPALAAAAVPGAATASPFTPSARSLAARKSG